MNSIKVSTSSLARPKVNPRRLKAPSPLPVRPLPIDKFSPPRGEKQVFLPNFTITFLHTPHKPPTFASFLVPLWFSKLDLKDYLYNLYNVQVLRIRSQVIQSPVREGKPGDRVIIPHKWFRPQSTKKMTVELVTGVKGQGPFVWPDEPENWAPWAKDQFDQARKEQEKAEERRKEGGRAWPEDMDDVGREARALAKMAGAQVRENPERVAPRGSMRALAEPEGGDGSVGSSVTPAQEVEEAIDRARQAPLAASGREERMRGERKLELGKGKGMVQKGVIEKKARKLPGARSAVMRKWYEQNNELFASDRLQYEEDKKKFVEMMERRKWREGEKLTE